MEDNIVNSKQESNYKSIPLTKGSSFNDELWTVAGVPLGDGNFWMYEDQNSKISSVDNGLIIEIDRFSKSNDQVQIFDNPKQLYLTKNQYKPEEVGKLSFSCLMKSEVTGGNPDDYKDGFGSFNVLDFASGMVFDIITNGVKSWVIYERLFMPGVTTPEQAFTNVIEITEPIDHSDFIECRIDYYEDQDKAEYYCNNNLVYTAENIPVEVDSLVTGFGFITLHPIENGKSVSCHGQGGRGVWQNFKFLAE